jgi:hypothetical protein
MFGTQVQNATHNALDSIQNINNDAWKHMSNGFKNTADYYNKTSGGTGGAPGTPAAGGTPGTPAAGGAPETTEQLANKLHNSQYQDFLKNSHMQEKFNKSGFDQNNTLNNIAHDQDISNGGMGAVGTHISDAVHAHGGNALMGAGIGAGIGGLVGGALGKSRGAGIGTMVGSGIGGLAGALA